MKAIRLEQPDQFKATEINPPAQPGPDEALFKIRRIGICGTDLHAYKGDQPFFSYPRILGHELGVEIIEVGDQITHLKAGDKASIEPYRNTTQDQAVRRGKTNCGEGLTVLGVHEDGGMCEFFTFPAELIHPSATLDYEQLALVEPLGIGFHAVNRAQLTPEDLVLVVGTGPIGIGTIQAACIHGNPVVAMDINEDRLAFCREKLKVTGTVNALAKDPIAEIRKQFGGDLPTVVLDATGSKKSMENCLNYVAHCGKIVFIGLFQGDFSFHDPYFHRKEMTIMSSRNALPEDFKQIIGLMESGKLDTDPWITHQVHFDEMIHHFDSWLKPENKVIKAMVSLD